MPRDHACVREEFLCVVKQWLPQSCQWKETVEGAYPTYDLARERALSLNKVDIECYVSRCKPPCKEEDGRWTDLDAAHEMARALDFIRDHWKYDEYMCSCCLRDEMYNDDAKHRKSCWVAIEFGLPRET
jgi:hypothetical protein